MAVTTGSVLVQKSFDEPDEIRRFERGTIDIVKIGERSVGRATFHPGWRWCEHVRPIAGTPLCEDEHFGYVLAGRLRIRMNDGSEAEYKAGDVMAVKPYHDAWVLGDEACVVIEWAAAATYAKK